MARRPSEQLAADRLWRLIPVWDRAQDDRGSGTLRGLLEALGVGLDAARGDVLRLLDDAFVDSCHPTLIPLIARLVGADVDMDTPINRQRYVVKHQLRERARRGTGGALDNLTWEVLGANADVLEETEWVAWGGVRPPTTHILGTEVTIEEMALRLDGGVRIHTRVARPIRRRQEWLTPTCVPQLFAVVPNGAVSLRRPDGTCILWEDDPAGLVGPGAAIQLDNLRWNGTWRAFDLAVHFAPLRVGEVPDVPPGVMVIDPEHGRLAACPQSGPDVLGTVRISYWEPLGAEMVGMTPVSLGRGIYAFSASHDSAGRAGALRDAYGRHLVSDGAADVADGEVRLKGLPKNRYRVCTRDSSYEIDRVGLRRFFRFEDPWGWERFKSVKLVTYLTTDVLSDFEVEVDVTSGLLRVGTSLDPEVVAYSWRDFVAHDAKAKLNRAVTRRIPIGRNFQTDVADRAPRHPEKNR